MCVCVVCQCVCVCSVCVCVCESVPCVPQNASVFSACMRVSASVSVCARACARVRVAGACARARACVYARMRQCARVCVSQRVTTVFEPPCVRACVRACCVVCVTVSAYICIAESIGDNTTDAKLTSTAAGATDEAAVSWAKANGPWR